MKRAIITGTVFALIASQAMAQTSACGTAGGRMTEAAIRTMVSNKYVCVGARPNLESNELHQQENVENGLIDYKKGPPAPNNPDPTEPVGRYSITTDTVPGSSPPATYGKVTYYYGPGATYSYFVKRNSVAYTYLFCTTGGGKDQVVLVQASPC
jgi:hypothetical protein